jgi:ATP-dependent Clp protease ATP-binding subunit ClpB
LNRIDDIIFFRSLTKTDIIQIVDIQTERLKSLLEDRKIEVQLTDAAKALMADIGYDVAYGARPLKRAIQKHIQNPLSMQLLEGNFRQGETVVIDAGSDGNILFRRKEKILEHQ